MRGAADTQLVGRDDELRRVRALVELRAGPRALVVSGEAGVGKTALWEAAVAHARKRGVLVLATRCSEAELPLALSGVADLVDRHLQDLAGELTPTQTSALAVAVGLEPPGGAPALVLPRAFGALVRALASKAPVLVAVDDVQWLDPPSAAVLAYAVRRLDDVPVAVITTQRGDGPDPLELERAVGSARYDRIELEGLSLGALAYLVRARLAVRLPRPLLTRVHAASGGNPMFALEFGRAFARREPGIGPLAVPASLHAVVAERVAVLPRRLQPLLALVAAAERPALSLLREVDAAAAGTLDEAVDAGVLAVEGGTVRFTHPLLAAAVYGALPQSRRRALHASLASAAHDVEERGRHLALSAVEPDAAIASVLDEAAARARGRGAPETAAELGQEALRLTPAGDPRHDERAVAVARHLEDAGRGREATEWLDDLLAAGLAGRPRAHALVLRAEVEHDVQATLPVLEEALEHVGDDATLRTEVLLRLSSYHLYSEDIPASADAARDAAAVAEAGGDGALLAAALMIAGERADLVGRPDPSLVERAESLAEVHGRPSSHFPSVREVRARMLLRRGDLNGARSLFEPVLVEALRTGVVPDCYRVSRELFDVEWRAGRWDVAGRHLAAAWAGLVENEGEPWGRAELLLRRTRLAALRGRAADAYSDAADAAAAAGVINWPLLSAASGWVVGFLELSLDEPGRAWDALASVLRIHVWGRIDVLEAVADGLEALVALGRLDEADGLASALREASGAGHLWAAPAALRCRALLLLGRGAEAEAAGVAEEAADGFAAVGFPFDRARALLVAGEALRRAGERREAGKRLEAAREVFAALGAALWMKRAERELRRARPRPRRDGELTAAELRVAALVAEGRKNREVAAQLFTTVATVEAHLTRIYRKTGARSRTELARRVADGSLSVDTG